MALQKEPSGLPVSTQAARVMPTIDVPLITTTVHPTANHIQAYQGPSQNPNNQAPNADYVVPAVHQNDQCLGTFYQNVYTTCVESSNLSCNLSF